MNRTAPHYLLLSETENHRQKSIGKWRFVLERMDGSGQIEVADEEPGVFGERLQLLTVVRGLEALEQPSRVTLVTPSRYVGRGIRTSLATWRENDWQWERFGEWTPIKNRDLWKRVDRALLFHDVDCKVWNLNQLLVNSIQSTRSLRSPGDRGRAAAGGRWNQNSSLFSGSNVQALSWSEIASAIAHRLNPFRADEAFSCA